MPMISINVPDRIIPAHTDEIYASIQDPIVALRNSMIDHVDATMIYGGSHVEEVRHVALIGTMLVSSLCANKAIDTSSLCGAIIHGYRDCVKFALVHMVSDEPIVSLECGPGARNVTFDIRFGNLMHNGDKL